MKIDPREAALLADEAARFSGSLKGRKTYNAPRGAAVYLLTSAQNNTPVHEGLWKNLLAYQKYLDAKLLVSQFTYNTGAYPEREVKPGTFSEYHEVWYADEITPYIYNDRLNISRALTFCGEINILPTADRPLSGFENYTGRSSGIFPHARQHMQSIPSLDATKFNYTTGCVTLRNYIQKKAGLKAEPQHAYGALIVEVDDDGDFFVRQLRATEDGNFQDLTVMVRDGRVTDGHRVEAFQPGDVHVDQMDPVVKATLWGKGGLVDTLKPYYQFLHDTLDFRSQNHHDRFNPHERFRKHVQSADSVEGELRRVARFLTETAPRPDCKLVVVDSNHDNALTRWLREAELAADPLNALTYLDLQRRIYWAIKQGDEDYHLLADVMRTMGVPESVRFLSPDESFVICRASGGIECGMHGHTGVGGAKGTPATFARVGRPANTGHVHAATIIDDLFAAGTCTRLRLSYNRGLSNWSQSHTVTYETGFRAIISQWRGKWRGKTASKRHSHRVDKKASHA